MLIIYFIFIIISMSIWNNSKRRQDLNNALSKLDTDTWLLLRKDIWLHILKNYTNQSTDFKKVCKTFRVWLKCKPIKLYPSVSVSHQPTISIPIQPLLIISEPHKMRFISKKKSSEKRKLFIKKSNRKFISRKKSKKMKRLKISEKITQADLSMKWQEDDSDNWDDNWDDYLDDYFDYSDKWSDCRDDNDSEDYDYHYKHPDIDYCDANYWAVVMGWG